MRLADLPPVTLLLPVIPLVVVALAPLPPHEIRVVAPREAFTPAPPVKLELAPPQLHIHF
jgi:hypothetical protein